MDDELLELAAAPSTRSVIETLSERLGGADPPALSEEALAGGEFRAALNFALAGALAGSPPPADLAVRLEPVMENTDLVIALFGCVTDGIAEALVESVAHSVHEAKRLGLILFLAASSFEGRAPPDELLRRIRLTARAELSGQGQILVGLAALEVGDPHVLEVARSAVVAADCPAGRWAGRDILRRLKTPLREMLPEEAPPDFFGGFTIRRGAPRTGRNDPCPCGSGKKYKRCCLTKEATDGPVADPTHPWGDRARFHRSMTDAQFKGLHPLEVARIGSSDLTTPRLVHTVERMTAFRLYDEAMRFLADLEKRRDLPEGTTPDSLRAEILMQALTETDLDRAEEILASFGSPDAVPDHMDFAAAILRRSPDALERIEALADKGLREPSDEALGQLAGVLIFYTPALGILLARGMMDPAEPLEVEKMLGQVEEARDMLLLPPNDPAWEIYDLLSERHVEAGLEVSAMERNEQLVAEAEELRQLVAEARANANSKRRSLERYKRELELATQAAREQWKEADRARRSAGPSSEERDKRLREKIEDLKVKIAEGNHERRELRRRLSAIGSRIDAAAREDTAPDPDEDLDDLEYEEEGDSERRAPRIPLFSREFREGLRSVADHVARDALATAGALAATQPGAWSSVKKVRHLEDHLSCRIGRHRALFRLVGEDEMEFRRLIHRRDLESTLRKMG